MKLNAFVYVEKKHLTFYRGVLLICTFPFTINIHSAFVNGYVRYRRENYYPDDSLYYSLLLFDLTWILVLLWYVVFGLKPRVA